MRTFIFFSLLLSTCYAAPAYAKIMDAVWDGSCHVIDQSTNIHQNPENVKKQTGYLPEEFDGYTGDISGCLPPLTVMGPK